MMLKFNPMNSTPVLVSWLVFLLVGPLCGRVCAAGPGDLIEAIRVTGNRRVPSETVRFYISSQPNMPLDSARLSLALEATGFINEGGAVREQSSELYPRILEPRVQTSRYI